MPTVLAQEYGPNKSDLTFEIMKDEVIFEALERQGFELPHGCLAGSCGACRIEVVAGAENLKEKSAVENDTIENIKKNLADKTLDQSYLTRNIRLSCRARAIGDITISKIK